jgi:hypothetical protein
MLINVEGSSPADQATTAPSTVTAIQERAGSAGSGRRSTRHWT